LTSSEEEIRDPLMAKVAGLLLSLIVRTLFLTGRKRFMGEENLVGFMKTGTPVIIASWHNRLAITPFNYLARAARGRRLWPIASASKDGAIAAWGLRFLGLKCVRGSSSRHGTRALRQMIRIMRAGDDLAFTPDGPRGPRHNGSRRAPPRRAFLEERTHAFAPVGRGEYVAQGLDLVLDVAPVVEIVGAHERTAGQRHDGR